LIGGSSKNPDVITLFQFQKLSKINFGNPSVIKADFDILYKNALRRS
jgi:hypothetical protein